MSPTIGLDDKAIERFKQQESFSKNSEDDNNNNNTTTTCDHNNNGRGDQALPIRTTTNQPQPVPYPAIHCEQPRELIPELCRQFYGLGWVSGTGGGMSIRQNGLIYVAPSGVQKERLQPEDLFVLDDSGRQLIEVPQNKQFKISECFSLFMLCYRIRNAGCCIHTHSKYANLITMMSEKLGGGQRNPKTNLLEFRISHQEMIKGLKLGSSDQTMKYNDTVVVPIIENVLCERDLVGPMGEAIRAYPQTNAILVQNHGAYFWGKTWTQAKGMAECYDYLFQIRLEAHRYGLC